MLLVDDHESLTGKDAGMEEASFELHAAMKHLLRNIKADSAVSTETGLSEVKPPKVSVPTFTEKVLSWKSIWEQFDGTIHCKTRD